MELDRELCPISELSPDVAASIRYIKGVITLLWPYAQSQGRMGFLLAEADFRIRAANGQVNIRAVGPSARALAAAGITVGDDLEITLLDPRFVENRNHKAGSAGGKNVAWDLEFDRRLIAKIIRGGKQLANIDVDDPAPSDSPHQSTPDSESVPASGSPRLRGPLDTQEWASPAYLKRPQPLDEPSLQHAYDSLASTDDDDEEGPSRKKRKSLRDWGSWTVLSGVPSPQKSAIRSSEGEGEKDLHLSQTTANLPATPPSPIPAGTAASPAEHEARHVGPVTAVPPSDVSPVGNCSNHDVPSPHASQNFVDADLAGSRYASDMADEPERSPAMQSSAPEDHVIIWQNLGSEAKPPAPMSAQSPTVPDAVSHGIPTDLDSPTPMFAPSQTFLKTASPSPARSVHESTEHEDSHSTGTDLPKLADGDAGQLGPGSPPWLPSSHQVTSQDWLSSAGDTSEEALKHAMHIAEHSDSPESFDDTFLRQMDDIPPEPLPSQGNPGNGSTSRSDVIDLISESSADEADDDAQNGLPEKFPSQEPTSHQTSSRPSRHGSLERKCRDDEARSHSSGSSCVDATERSNQREDQSSCFGEYIKRDECPLPATLQSEIPENHFPVTTADTLKHTADEPVIANQDFFPWSQELGNVGNADRKPFDFSHGLDSTRRFRTPGREEGSSLSMASPAGSGFSFRTPTNRERDAFFSPMDDFDGVPDFTPIPFGDDFITTPTTVTSNVSDGRGHTPPRPLDPSAIEVESDAVMDRLETSKDNALSAAPASERSLHAPGMCLPRKRFGDVLFVKDSEESTIHSDNSVSTVSYLDYLEEVEPESYSSRDWMEPFAGKQPDVRVASNYEHGASPIERGLGEHGEPDHRRPPFTERIEPTSPLLFSSPSVGSQSSGHGHPTVETLDQDGGDSFVSVGARSGTYSLAQQSWVSSQMPMTPEPSQGVAIPRSLAAPVPVEQRLPISPGLTQKSPGRNAVESHSPSPSVGYGNIAAEAAASKAESSDTDLNDWGDWQADEDLFSTPFASFSPLDWLRFFCSSEKENSGINLDFCSLVVSDSAEPQKSSTGSRDWYTTFEMTDELSFPKRTQIQIFRPHCCALPRPKAGDVMVLHNMGVASFHGELRAVSREDSAWCVFEFGRPDFNGEGSDGHEWRETCATTPVRRGFYERREAKRLREWWLQMVARKIGKMDRKAAREAARKEAGREEVAREGGEEANEELDK